LEYFPLRIIGFAGLIQHRPWDGEFSDVVQKSRPPQAVAVGLGQFQLICDQIGDGSDPL